MYMLSYTKKSMFQNTFFCCNFFIPYPILKNEACKAVE